MKLTEEIDSWLTHFYIESWIDKNTENRYRRELKQILDNQKLRELIEEIVNHEAFKFWHAGFFREQLIAILKENKK